MPSAKVKGAEAARAGDSAASEPSTKAIDEANDSIIVMATTTQPISTDVQGATVETSAANEIVATIVNVQEYNNRYFIELSENFEGRDEKGQKVVTNTISKGARSILKAIKLPIARVIQAKTNGRPEQYDICSLIGMIVLGGEIRIKRQLVAAGDVIPNSEDERRAKAECFATEIVSIKTDCNDLLPFIMDEIKTIQDRNRNNVATNPFEL